MRFFTKKISVIFAGTLLALSVFAGTTAQEKIMENTPTFKPTFPLGKANTAYSQYFTGKSWLASLTQNAEQLGVPIANVTFEPGCRNNWHSHTGGQILIATDGKGFYQEKGKPARLLRPGDVVEIAPDVVHWHGAAPDSWFSHLAIECNPKTNKNTWLEPVNDEQYREATTPFYPVPATTRNAGAEKNFRRWFPQGEESDWRRTDPEMATTFENFAFGEVFEQSACLDDRTRVLVSLAASIARHALAQYETLLEAAKTAGISPVELKEVLYQAIPYVGFAGVCDFVPATNAFLEKNGVALPLPGQATTTKETRLDKGLEKQISIFGKGILTGNEATPDNQKHFRRFLSSNCFGDYVVRDGLDTATRELLTFSMLASLGGCEAQLKAHIAGNIAVGNDKAKLIAVATHLLPYNGYPRTLNALAALNEVVPEKLQQKQK